MYCPQPHLQDYKKCIDKIDSYFSKWNLSEYLKKSNVMAILLWLCNGPASFQRGPTFRSRQSQIKSVTCSFRNQNNLDFESGLFCFSIRKEQQAAYVLYIRYLINRQWCVFKIGSNSGWSCSHPDYFLSNRFPMITFPKHRDILFACLVIVFIVLDIQLISCIYVASALCTLSINFWSKGPALH